jgi:hypothetical protein
VPERGIERRVAPLLERVKVPAIDPDAAGVNTIGTFTLCAGLSVIGVVMPVLKPVPVMPSLVMLAAPDPLLVTFTVNVTGVLITCDPNPRLEGVAVRLGEPGATGVGLGVGVGPGGVPPLDLVAPAPPPQPITHIRERTKRRTTLECLLAILVLCKGTPQTQKHSVDAAA